MGKDSYFIDSDFHVVCARSKNNGEREIGGEKKVVRCVGKVRVPRKEGLVDLLVLVRGAESYYTDSDFHPVCDRSKNNDERKRRIK